MPLTPGTRLGAYEIVSALGAGGMGEVYKARDIRLDRAVAVKVLTGALAGDPESRARFEQEARAIAALNHPHICTIHDVGRHGDVDYLVMELLGGETLAERIRKSGAGLPLGEALDLAIQIGDALDRAHRAGIVHRDLKPGNIMLVRGPGQSSPIAKLLDFGLAAQAAPAGPPASIQTSMATMPPSLVATKPASGSTASFSGTVQYMAPEQIDAQASDHRVDVFAFGCVLYEMLAGRKAFEGGSAMSVIAAVMSLEPKEIPALRSAPPVIEHLLRRCLEKDRERRWQNMGDVTGELRWIASQPLTAAATVAAAPPLSPVRRLGMVAGVAAVSIAGVVALLAGLRQVREDAPVRTAAPSLQFEVTTPPTDTPGMALSPDGRQLAFVANEERRSMLWIRSFDKVESRMLPGTAGARAPFWSPDGKAIGYFTANKLRRVDVVSGASMDIADVSNGRGGTWGPEGTILFAPGVDSPIVRVSSAGGEVTPVTTPFGRTGHRAPQFLEDGKRFLFHVALGAPEVNGTYIGSLDRTPPVRVLGTQSAVRFALPGYLVTVQQGALVAYAFSSGSGTVSGEPIVIARGLDEDGTGAAAFAASDTGVLAYRFGGRQRRQPQWTDRTGRMLTSIGEGGTDAIGSPELSLDERAIALFLNPRGNNEIGIIDLERRLPRLLTNGPPADAHPLWDPDGRHVVYVSGRLDGSGPVRQAVDGTGMPHTLFPNDTAGAALSWTRDRAWVLLRQGGQLPDLVAVSIDGTRTIPIATTKGDETEGQFSPDGKWVAYVSNDTGNAEVYLQAFPVSAGRTQVSAAGGTQVRWSADGKEIFYIAPDGTMMGVRVASPGGAPTLQAPVALFRTFLATGANVIGNKAQYAVSRDGRFLLNAAIEASSSPIIVTVNWAEAFGR
jgi:Tol biopolymer transport system component